MFSGLTIWSWINTWHALLWGDTSHAPRFPQVLVVLCKVEASWAFFPVHFGMSIFILIQLMFRQSCWWGFMSVTSDITRRQNFTTNSLIHWLLKSFCTLFHNVPWALDEGVFYRCVHWDWAVQLCILIGWDFLSWSLSVAKRSFLAGGEDYVYLWI